MAWAKDTNARVTRWFLALQDFHFLVQHRAGAANSNTGGLFRIWSAFAGLSGVTPHPHLVSPLLHHIITTPGQDAWWGGSVTSFPSPNEHCPGNSRGAPAHQSSQADRPHLRLINPSAHKQSAQRRTERNLSMRQQTNFLSVHFQTGARDRPAPPQAEHGLTRTWTRLRAPQQARAQTPFTLTNKIHPLGT